MSKGWNDRICLYRKLRGLKQKEMAEKLGVSDRHYQNIEYGKVDINISTLLKLSEVLKVGTSQLLPSKMNIEDRFDDFPGAMCICDLEGNILHSNSICQIWMGEVDKDHPPTVFEKWGQSFAEESELKKFEVDFKEFFDSSRDDLMKRKVFFNFADNKSRQIELSAKKLRTGESEAYGFIFLGQLI